jgi:phosphopantetheinyl transferase (holo-ACP synthase)
MKTKSSYAQYVETIKREDFLSFYSSCNPEDYFSVRELLTYKFPEKAGSLAGRYLIKKTICNYLKKPGKMCEIEILNDNSGKPDVFIGTGLLDAVGDAGIKKIICSISHSRNYIAGMTILCF